MNAAVFTEALDIAYDVRIRSTRVLVHPRDFTAHEKHDRAARFGRRPARPNLRGCAAQGSNRRFATM